MAQQRSNFASASPGGGGSSKRGSEGSAGRVAFCGFCMWFARAGAGRLHGARGHDALTGFLGFRPNGRLRRRRLGGNRHAGRTVRTAVLRQRFSSFCLGFRTKDGRVEGVNLIGMVADM